MYSCRPDRRTVLRFIMLHAGLSFTLSFGCDRSGEVFYSCCVWLCRKGRAYLVLDGIDACLVIMVALGCYCCVPWSHSNELMILMLAKSSVG